MILRILSLMLVLTMAGCTSNQAGSPIHIDKKWHTHTLANGFQYHFYPTNSESIELKLIVNVGSLNEAPSERGFAHFIEHLAFRSTAHFPEGVLFDDVGDFSLEFGPDLNGVTDYSRTIYTLTLPNKEKLNEALTWFADILQGIQFSADAVETERDVIFGEWRFDDKAFKAWPMQLYEQLLVNTPYADKDPIGETQSLEQATPESLAAFYQKWYQMDKAQLIIVGELDPVQIQTKINDHFLIAKDGPLSKGGFTKPQKHLVQKIDKKITYPNTLQAKAGNSAAIVMSMDLGDYIYPTTLEEQSQQWLEWMLIDLIKSRLTDEFEKNKTQTEAIYNNFAFLPGLNYYELVLEFHHGKRRELLIELADALASLRDLGVNQDEFSTLMKRFESMGYFLFHTQAKEIADGASHSLFFNTLPQDERQLSQNYANFLKNIDKTKVNKAIRTFLSKDNKALTFVFAQNEKIQAVKPLQDIFFTRLKKEGDIFDNKKITLNLPEPKVTEIKALDIKTSNKHLHEWQLENGLRAQFYQLDDLTQSTHMILRAKGGVAALSMQERAALDMLYQTYVNGRLNELRAVDFFNILKEKGIYIEPAVYSSSHDFAISTNSRHVTEALSAFIYFIQHVEPSYAAFEREKSRILDTMDNLPQSPYKQFQRAVKSMVYLAGSYERPIEKDVYEKITFEDVKKVYAKLFADLGHFNLYVVSEQPVEKISAWTSRYLSHLSQARKETLPTHVLFNEKGGEIVKHQSPEERTFIETLHLTKVGPRDVTALFIEEISSRVLQRRYSKIMREEHGFDYDPTLYSWGRDGDEIHVTTTTALISPDKEDQLSILWPEIIKFLSQPISAKEKNRAQYQFEKELDNVRHSGKLLVGALARYGTWGYDYSGLFEPKQVLKRIKKAQLNKLTQSIFNRSVRFKSVLRPQIPLSAPLKTNLGRYL